MYVLYMYANVTVLLLFRYLYIIHILPYLYLLLYVPEVVQVKYVCLYHHHQRCIFTAKKTAHKTKTEIKSFSAISFFLLFFFW